MRILGQLQDKELIFCFGEVDVRLHIKYKHQQLGIPVEQLIDATAEKYISYIANLRSRNFSIHVFNVIPTGDFQGTAAEKWKKGLHYPFTATYEERKHYTELLNAAYAVNCNKLQVPFIDIYHKLVDETGKRRKELVFDFAHLNNSCADFVMDAYFPENRND
jgi:hypothetical protein